MVLLVAKVDLFRKIKVKMRRENDLPLFCLSFYFMVLLVAKVDVGTGQTTSSPTIPPPTVGTAPPLKQLKIAVPVKRGFREFVRVDNGTDFSGFAIEVFRAVVTAALPKLFTYNFIPYAKPDGTMNGTYDNMLEAVYKKEYDAAVGDIIIEYSRTQWVKFTTPYLDSGNTLLFRVKRAGISSFPSWFIKTALVVFLITAIVFCILEYAKKNDSDYGSHETQVMHRERMRAIRDTRVVMVLWFAVLLLLTTCYVASLTSLLIPGRSHIDNRNLTQLRLANEKVGYSCTSFTVNFLTSEEGFQESHLLCFNSEEEMMDLLDKGSVAAVYHRTRYLQLFLARRSCDNIYALSPSFKTLTGGFAFAFQDDSPWTGLVSDGILELIDNGKLAKIQDKTVGSLASCEDDISSGVGSNILLNTAIAGMACFAFVLAILYAIYFAKMCKSTST